MDLPLISKSHFTRTKRAALLAHATKLIQAQSTLGVLSVALVLTGFLTITPQAYSRDKLQENRIYKSSYYLGRGDTGIASTDNYQAIFYNPAALARGKGIYKETVLLSPHVEFSQATKNLIKTATAGDSSIIDTVKANIGKPQHVGYNNFTGAVLRRAAIGAFASGDIDLMAYKAQEFHGLETIEAYAYQNVGATFSLAESFILPNFMMGITAKYLMRGRAEFSVNISEADQAKEKLENLDDILAKGEGVGADFGLLYQFGGQLNPSFALTVNDIGNTQITSTTKTDLDLDLKQTVNLGLALEPGTKLSKFKLLLDVRDVLSQVEENFRKKVFLGSEINVMEMIGASGGLYQGYPTAGLFWDMRVFRVDLGLYSVERSERVGKRQDQRYYISMKAGL